MILKGSDLVTIVWKLPQTLVQEGLHMIPARSAVVMTVWKLPKNTCTSGSPHDTGKVCCSDDSVEASQKHLYKWVLYDTLEVFCSGDTTLLKTPFKWVPYEAPHNANVFAVVIVIV